MKKGQAAVEFLMTYGWAILAAIVVIGVLAYFGVFSPKAYVPTQCLLSAPLSCDKNQVAATTSDVTFVIRNGGIDSLNITDVSITGCGSNSSSFEIAADSTQTVIVPCSPALSSGDKFRGDVSVTYVVSGGELEQTSSGNIVVKVA